MPHLSASLRSDAPPKDVVWIHDVREGGVLRYRMGRRGSALVAEWPRIATLTCSESGRHAQLLPAPGCPRGALEKLRGVVKAMLGDLRGGIAIHASAVRLGGQGILLLGDAGAGKSTAATQLCREHRARLLADDAALLEVRAGVMRIVPTEHSHYLTPASAAALGVRLPRARLASGKARVRPEVVGQRPARVAAVVALRFDDKLRSALVRRLSGAHAALRLLSAMFRFDVENRRRELERVSSLYEQASFLEISRPRAQPDVVGLILSAVGDLR